MVRGIRFSLVRAWPFVEYETGLGQSDGKSSGEPQRKISGQGQVDTELSSYCLPGGTPSVGGTQPCSGAFPMNIPELVTHAKVRLGGGAGELPAQKRKAKQRVEIHGKPITGHVPGLRQDRQRPAPSRAS